MTTLFLDFDGVVNFEASRSAYNKHASSLNLPGYLRKMDLSTHLGWERVNFSAELVRKLNQAQANGLFTWLWLTTWVAEAESVVKPALRTNSDGFVPWDPWTGVTSENRAQVRASRKYEALKAAHNNEPFVWVDDEATVMYNPDDFDVPALVLTPDSRFGLTNTDVENLVEFAVKHKDWNK